jgi:hypothetical protein
VLDATRLVAHDCCPRRFFFEHCNHIRGAGHPMSLTFGGAFAAGLEKYRVLRHSGYAHGPALAVAHERIISKWGDAPLESDRPSDPRSLLRCHHALEAYLTEFPWDFDALRPHPSPSGGFEFSISLPLDDDRFPRHPSGDPYIYHCRIDALGTHSTLPVHCDEKTTTILKSDWTTQWTYRRQFIGYNWALRQLGLGAHFILVRGIVVHKDDFLFPEAGPLRVSDATLRAFEDDLVDTVWEIAEHSRTSLWPRRWGNACQSYNRPCPFLDVCFGDPAFAQSFLATMPRNPWNPQERDS